MDDNFFHSFLPSDFTILGYRLKPFSPWHSFLLYALDSPYTRPGARIRSEDLLQALKVCSVQFPEQPIFKRSFSDWRRNKKLQDPHILQRSSNYFTLYLSRSNSKPQFWNSEEEESNLTGPSLLLLVSGLVEKGFRWEESWNLSMGQILWIDACIGERNGSKRRFQWEDDFAEVDNLPDLTKLSEEELYQQAVKDLGPARAAKWKASRKKNRRKLEK